MKTNWHDKQRIPQSVSYHEQGDYQEQIQFPCFPTQSFTRWSVMNVFHSLANWSPIYQYGAKSQQKILLRSENVEKHINFPWTAVFSSPFNQSSKNLDHAGHPKKSNATSAVFGDVIPMPQYCRNPRKTPFFRRRFKPTSLPPVTSNGTFRCVSVQVTHHGLLHLPAALDFSRVTKMAMFAVCASKKKTWVPWMFHVGMF